MNTYKTSICGFLRLMRDRGGNFAIISAAVLPLILFGAGVSIDLTQMLLNKNKLQDATDAAALATASGLANKKIPDKTAAEKFALNFISAQMKVDATYFGDDKLKPKIAISEAAGPAGGKNYKVTINAQYDQQFNALTRLMGHKSATLQTAGVAESTSGSRIALSMYLALDRSGSMTFVTNEKKPNTTCDNYTSASWPNPTNSKNPCYIKKIEALKTAANTLFAELDKADPDKELIRTGAVSYTHETQSPSALAWGTAKAKTYVNALPSEGGTDSSGAMSIAQKALADGDEQKEHEKKGNSTVNKYIVLMTDGENTGNSATWNPTLDTKTLTTCTLAKASGMTVYTVAFMAPANGKTLLLACASTPSHYYGAEDMSSLVAAFKQIAQKATAETIRLTN